MTAVAHRPRSAADAPADLPAELDDTLAEHLGAQFLAHRPAAVGSMDAACGAEIRDCQRFGAWYARSQSTRPCRAAACYPGGWGWIAR